MNTGHTVNSRYVVYSNFYNEGWAVMSIFDKLCTCPTTPTLLRTKVIETTTHGTGYCHSENIKLNLDLIF